MVAFFFVCVDNLAGRPVLFVCINACDCVNDT